MSGVIIILVSRPGRVNGSQLTCSQSDQRREAIICSRSSYCSHKATPVSLAKLLSQQKVQLQETSARIAAAYGMLSIQEGIATSTNPLHMLPSITECCIGRCRGYCHQPGCICHITLTGDGVPSAEQLLRSSTGHNLFCCCCCCRTWRRPPWKKWQQSPQSYWTGNATNAAAGEAQAHGLGCNPHANPSLLLFPKRISDDSEHCRHAWAPSNLFTGLPAELHDLANWVSWSWDAQVLLSECE